MTQAEITMLFMLSDSRSLFLAGDTAQSVMEWVAFRFSEVRSVAFHLGVCSVAFHLGVCVPDNLNDLEPQLPLALWNSGFGARGAGQVVFPVSRRCQ